MKIVTTLDFFRVLDEDFTWRLQEISHMYGQIGSSTSVAERSLVRAGIPLLYAHWEGFVKESTLQYIDWVENQRETLRNLNPSLMALGLRKQISILLQSKNDLQNSIVVQEMLVKLENRASLSFDGSIKTESNLSSKVFKRIVESIGLDWSPYSTKENFIDESLVGTRNKIAHGEFKALGKAEFKSVKDDTVTLMRQFKNDLENAAAQGAYRK